MRHSARQIAINQVRVPTGRRAVGDLRELVASVQEIGLLHPIVVTEDLRLIAGLHRLRACEHLGWTRIPATVLSAKRAKIELAELDENLARTELTVLERAEQLARRKELYEALHPETRRGVAGGRASGAARRGKRTTDTLSLVRLVAKQGHVSTRTIERHIQIARAIPDELRDRLRGTWVADDQRSLLQLARLPGREQAAVVGRLVRGSAGSVRLAKAQVVARTLHRVSPPSGRFGVIVVDPPWPYEQYNEDYPAMPFEAINALPIGSLLEDNAVVWLWTTNLMMRHAFSCLDAWGVQEQTILTWVKHKIGKGWYLRNQTEHCIVATRGRPTLALGGQSTFLHARAHERGRKPAEFYRLVEGLCPGAKLEMFARETRRGWVTWGAERTKFDRQTG